jgi:hypothetical protein
MSSIKSSITMTASPPGRFIQPPDYDVRPSRRQNHSFNRRFIAFIQELWRRIKIMKADSERAGDGTRSRERSEERRHDDEVWSRTNG